MSSESGTSQILEGIDTMGELCQLIARSIEPATDDTLIGTAAIPATQTSVTVPDPAVAHPTMGFPHRA